MSASDNRLQKIFKVLTAKERAIMRLRWFKEDAEEPAELLQTTPWEQIGEINRLARFGDATQHEVSWYGTWLQTRLDAINVRFGMVDCLRLWGLHADQLRTRLVCDAGEPVTRSEYDARLAAARVERLPVSALAELLSEADLDAEDLDDRQYDQRVRDHERELRRLVAERTLPGTGRGRGLQITAGAFYDWRGEPAPVVPEWALGFEVFPDQAAEEVQRLRAQREALHELLAQAPCPSPLDAMAEDGRSNIDILGRNLVRLVAGELTGAWSELLAIEQIVKDASERFEGEEPLHPDARQLLEETKAAAAGLRESLSPWFGDLLLPDEPDERVVEALSGIIKQRGGET